MSFAKLESPSATPSIAPSHAGPAPIAARNAGRTAVAVSWLQSLNRLVRPTPSTVRLSQDCFSADSGMRKQFTVDSSQLKVQNVIVTWLRITHTIGFQERRNSKAAARQPK